MIMVYYGRYVLLHLHASIIRPTVNDYKRRPGQKASGRDPAAASRGIRFNGSTASRNSQTYFGGIFMFHNAVHRRTLSMFLIFCMVMDISQFAGISAFAKADTGGIISSFQKLPSSVSSQTVALGTFQSGLNLPDTLTVTVRLEPETAKSKPVSNSGGNQDESSSAVLSDTASNAGGRQQDTEPESAVPSESMAASSAVCPDAASDAGDRQEDTEPESAALSESMAASPANTGDTQPDSSAKAAVSDAVTREIPVTWVSSPDYDGDTAGKYEFTPVLPDGYSLGDGVELPEITVTVEKSAGTITAFGKFTDSVRWQRTDSPELPTSVKGTVGGKSVDIPVAWQADHDFDIASPEKGLYVFTAQPDGYSIKDGVEPPRIAVYVPVFSGLMSMLLSSVMSSKADLSIETAAQLSELAVLVNDGKLESFITGSSSGTVSVALENDLDLSGYGEGYNGGKGWTPIGEHVDGKNDIPFKGKFDGGNHTVIGLYINDSSLVGAGLFGAVSGTVENLELSDINVTGNKYVGGVAGCVSGGTVQSCCVTGTVASPVSDKHYYVGGVAGCVSGGTVQNCCVTGTVTGYSEIGGVVGFTKTNNAVQKCYAAGTVNGEDKVGGVVGYADSPMQNCYAANTVRGNDSVGGVAGFVESDKTIKYCYSTGTVSGSNSVGGVVGYANGMEGGKLQNCTALNPSVSGSGAGRVDGCSFVSKIIYSGNYAWSGMAGGGNNKTANGRDGADAGASKIQNTSFWTNTLGFDGCVWTIEDNKLPVLKNVSGEQDGSIPVYILTSSSQPFLGNGTTNDPYQISSAEQLAELANLVNAANSTYNLATYKLTCNLDLSAYGKNYNGGKGWVPIGRYSNTNNIPFQGTFDGGGHTVSGLYINDSTLDGAGLFGCIDNGTVKNCRFTGAVSGRDCVGSATGYILGYTYQGRVYESTVENCSSACTINGRSQVGGMVGWEGGSTLQNCYSTGTVKGSDQVGGMVGHLNEGTMQNCYTTSTVSGNSNVGGVAGLMQLGLVKNCTALNPSVSGSSNLGRVAGQNSYDLGTLFGNYAWSGMTVNGKSVSSSNADSINGADASPEMILSETAFWTNTLKFSSDDWTIAANRLPVLKSIFGTQSGAPGLYLMPQNITYASLTKTQFTYNGALQKPGVKFGDITLTEGKDYSIEITSTDDSGDGTSAGINAGKATITLNGKGNYSGTTTANYTIGKVPMKKVTLSGTQFTYNGALQKPGVKFGDITLTEGKDYSIEITSTDDSGDGTSAGINAGKVTITFNSKGNYSGTTTANYTIAPASITGVTVKLNPASFTFDGNSHIPAVTASFGNTDLTEDVDYSAQITSADGSGTSAGTNAGTVTITLNGKGNYSGTTTTNYTIGKVSMSNVTISDTPLTYSGAEQTPEVTFNGTTLKKDKDYSAQITSADGSGTSAGTNAGTVTITLNGKGNYSGTTTTNYTIGKVSMSNVTISDTPLTYSGAEQTPEVTFNGTTLKKDKDYSIEITSTDDSGDGTSAGTNAGTVSITLTGKGNYSGTTTANYTIGKVPMNNVTISDTPLTYSGAEQTPEVTYNGNTLKKDKDYSVKITSTDDSGDGTSAGTNAGTVSITVTGKGNYTGTKTAAYTISKVPLTITNATVSNKAYDGTVAATVGSVTLSGFINNETLTLNQDYTVSGTFSDAQIGTNKQVLVTVTMLNTAKANHYAVPGVYVCRANIHNDRSSYDDNTNTGTALPALLTDAATGVEADISGAAFPMSVNGVTLSTTRPKISGASADPQGAAAYQLAVSSTALNIVGSPSLYSIKLLNQNGSTISSFTGSVIVKLPVPVGIHGTPRVFRREPDGTFTDMNAKVENGYLVFRTTHFSYYIVAGTGDSITLDTKSYEMPLGGEYRIGVKQTGKKNVALKVRSTNSGVAAARLANGSVQVNGTGVGTAWIILDVFDDKNKLLAHVSTRIDVKTGIRPRGDSTRQIVAYTVRDTADSLTLDTKSYELTIGGKYQIGAWLTGGKAVTVRYYSANNKIASVTKLPNGNYQVTGNRKGTTWIMFDVYDSKNEFLTHASTHIDVKDGVHPNGNSAKQIGVF